MPQPSQQLLSLDEIQGTVREILLRDSSAFEPLSPEISVEDLAYGERKRCEVMWPDTEREHYSVFVRAYLHKITPTNVSDVTSIEFHYRSEQPAIIVGWFCLKPDLRKQGLGRVLFNKMEEMAESLGCQKDIYLPFVTNPEFWRHFNYDFYKNVNVSGVQRAFWKKQ